MKQVDNNCTFNNVLTCEFWNSSSPPPHHNQMTLSILNVGMLVCFLHKRIMVQHLSGTFAYVRKYLNTYLSQSDIKSEIHRASITSKQTHYKCWVSVFLISFYLSPFMKALIVQTKFGTLTSLILWLCPFGGNVKSDAVGQLGCKVRNIVLG